MRSVCGFVFALLLTTGVFAQNRSGFVTTPGVVRSFPSVVFPGGTSALPGVTRTTGSVVFPGSGGPQIAVPAIPFGVPGRTGIVTPGRNGQFNNGFRNGFNNGFNNGFKDGNRFRNGNNNNGNVIAYPVPYPIYEGGGGYGGYDPSMVQAPAQTPPNVIVIAPQGPGYGGPGYPGPNYQLGPAGAPPQSSMVELPQAPQEAAASTATHYLIALKDHSVYSAVAYFVEGDTLHYFTTGNAHSQVKISLVDRDLTHRLNEDSGLEVKLPPVK